MKTTLPLLIAALLSFNQPTYSAPEANATPEDFVTAMISTANVKMLYTEFFQVTASAPESLDEIGYPEAYGKNALVKHLDIDPYSGAIMVGLSPTFGQNAWVALIPKIGNYHIDGWVCRTTVSNHIVSQSGCESDVSYDTITQVADTALFEATLVSLFPIRTSYHESYQTIGTLPTSLEEIGANDKWVNSSNVDHIIIDAKRRAILVGLSAAFGTNEWLAFIPIVNRNGSLSWTCQTTLPSSIAGSSCRSDVPTGLLIR